MFEWLFDRNKKVVIQQGNPVVHEEFKPVVHEEVKPEVDELAEQIKIALSGKCISDRQIFEDFVLKTYKAHIKSLFKYPVRCSLLGLATKDMIRIGGDNDTAVFLDEEAGVFYHFKFRNDMSKNELGDLVVEDRDFSISIDYSEALLDYLSTIHTEDETLLKVRSIMMDYKGE